MMLIRLEKFHLIVVVVLTSGVVSFNLMSKPDLAFEGLPDSRFGFSLAYTYVQNQFNLLVGAPDKPTNDESAWKGGSVYRCRLVAERLNCHVLLFDVTGNTQEWDGRRLVEVDDKVAQLFGSSLSASLNATVLACGPNYVYKTRNGDKREPIGNCQLMTLTNQDALTKYYPCKRGSLGQNNQGHCQAGFSAKLTNDGKHAIIGAVGSYFWQGQVFLYDVEDLRSTYSFHESQKQTPLMEHSNSLMGYAVEVAYLDGQPFMIVGVPRGGSLKGQVRILSADMKEVQLLEGFQLGEYFGHSLAVGSFMKASTNSAPSVCLLVGAPSHSEKGLLDVGRVYVYLYNDQTRLFHHFSILSSSSKNNSKFGFSIANIGDVNIDGFEDVAIGAPYDDEGGTVYIHYGTHDGFLTDHVQPITAAANQPTSRDTFIGFGFSILGGPDVDKNWYPDVFIGNPFTNSVFLVKSRPVIKMNQTMISEPPSIDLDLCYDLENTSNVACFRVETCLQYRGAGVANIISLKLSWNFDIQSLYGSRIIVVQTKKKKSKKVDRKRRNSKTETYQTDGLQRNSSSNDNSNNVEQYKNTDLRKLGVKEKIRLRLGVRKCFNVSFTVKNGLRDKFSPINVRLVYDLVSQKNETFGSVLNGLEANETSIKIPLTKDCGDDFVCHPDLSVHASMTQSYHNLNSNENLEMVVGVANNGEHAYETLLTILLPTGVAFVALRTQDEVHCSYYNNQTTSQQQEPQISDQQLLQHLLHQPSYNYIQCHLGNPFKNHQTTTMKLHLSSGNVPAQTSTLDFQLIVNSSNTEKSTDLASNFVNISLPAYAFIMLEIKGVPQPMQLLYSNNFSSFDESLPSFVHLYEVYNAGPGIIIEGKMTIKWPSFISCRSSSSLLYPFTIIQQLKGTHGDDVVSCFHDNHFPRRTHQLALSNQTHAHKQDCSEWEVHMSNITCTVVDLFKSHSSVVRVEAVLNLDTVSKMRSKFKGFMLTSEGVFEIIHHPYKVNASIWMPKDIKIQTFVGLATKNNDGLEIGWMEVVLSIIAAFSILFLFILMLWKAKFFDRQSRQDFEDISKHKTYRVHKIPSKFNNADFF